MMAKGVGALLSLALAGLCSAQSGQSGGESLAAEGAAAYRAKQDAQLLQEGQLQLYSLSAVDSLVRAS